VIGMTAMPEAKLAREAELPYALVAMVTDYDAWREGEAAVDVAAVLAQVGANGVLARETVRRMLQGLPEERPASPIDTVLDAAIITAPGARDAGLAAKLDAVAGRVLGEGGAQT
jgi:5'-methylthioadenosine phosphorylase